MTQIKVNYIYEVLLSLLKKEIHQRELTKELKTSLTKIQSVLKPDGFNVGWNQKPAGGQVIPHLHIHIFPRYNGDSGGSMHSIVEKWQGNVKEVAELFK